MRRCKQPSTILISFLLIVNQFVAAFLVERVPSPSRSQGYLSASSNGPAQTAVVALTREDGKNGKLKKELLENSRLGEKIEILELPCIAHADGKDFEVLGSVLGGEQWDFVVVTSPEAARVLASVWDVVKNSPPPVAAVGKATEATLNNFGISVSFCPSKATAQTLVEELPSKGDFSQVLYPASAKAKKTLQNGLAARGFIVTRLNTYDTVTAEWTPEQKEQAKRVNVTCFGSPSSVKGWLLNTGDRKDTLAACIGETSATACREHNWSESRIFFPEKPGVPGWATAVADAIESTSLVNSE